ncbi:MAG: glycosyltransferase family 2 protein [Chthoniobacterales bacterium]
MPQVSAINHGILIPSYNSGQALLKTCSEALTCKLPTLVVLDGCSDNSEEFLQKYLTENAVSSAALEILSLPTNEGKGAAVLAGLRHWFQTKKFPPTHAVVLDADGQHDCCDILKMCALSEKNPDAVILGTPIFGPDAPAERVKGRRVGNWWSNLNSAGCGIADSLFGFRIYPTKATLDILSSIRTARRFDFDTEIAIRLVWAGVYPINFPTQVTYPKKSEGGVTHFHYLRDNLLLVGTHTRLFFGMLFRLPRLLRLRKKFQVRRNSDV